MPLIEYRGTILKAEGHRMDACPCGAKRGRVHVGKAGDGSSSSKKVLSDGTVRRSEKRGNEVGSSRD